MDAMWSSWVFCMEFCYSILSVIQILSIFPSVVFNIVAFPLYQVLQLSSEHAAINDFFYKVLFFSIH